MWRDSIWLDLDGIADLAWEGARRERRCFFTHVLLEANCRGPGGATPWQHLLSREWGRSP
jgi:hypothetical protein